MIEYLKQVLPRIQNVSKNLDHVEVFIEKPWVMLKEDSPEHLEYEFYRDNTLLVSNGGEVTWGKWALTPSSQKLILTYGGKSLLIKHAFIDDALMIIKLSGSPDPSMVFVNSQKIPDLNYSAYLDAMLSKIENAAKQATKPVNKKPIVEETNSTPKTETVKAFVIDKSKEKYAMTFPDNEYNETGKILITGFIWNYAHADIYYYYENGTYKKEYYLEEHDVNLDGTKMHVFVKERDQIKKGDKVYYLNNSREFLNHYKPIVFKPKDKTFLKYQIIIDEKGNVLEYKSPNIGFHIIEGLITYVKTLVLVGIGWLIWTLYRFLFQ